MIKKERINNVYCPGCNQKVRSEKDHVVGWSRGIPLYSCVE